MTDAILDFDADDTTEEVKPDIPFRLGGEVFHAVPEMAGAVILDFAKLTNVSQEELDAMPEADKQRIGQESMLAVLGFLRTAVIAEDWERFEAVTHRVGRGTQTIGIAKLTKVANGLVGLYSNPTGGSSPSEYSNPPSGPGSTGGASPAVTKFSRAKKPVSASLR